MKSPPELWAEVSDVEALARHLGEFGEIRITRLEPETTVAWEGERASGTVHLEPSGWGTKVTLTASIPEPKAEPEPAAPEPEPEPAPPAAEKLGFWARLFGRRRKPTPEAMPAPEPVAVEPEPVAPTLDGPRAEQILGSVLDDLGAAHHRPFSRG